LEPQTLEISASNKSTVRKSSGTGGRRDCRRVRPARTTVGMDAGLRRHDGGHLHHLVTPAKAGVHSGSPDSPIAISMDASLRWHDGETSASFRHPSEGWGPFGLAGFRVAVSMDASFRWHDGGHLHHFVTPAKAGVHSGSPNSTSRSAWMPAFAGMTGRHLSRHPLVTPTMDASPVARWLPDPGGPATAPRADTETFQW
jgi:hypothetical protein